MLDVGTPFAEGACGKISGFPALWLAKGHALLCLLDAFRCRRLGEAGVPWGGAGDAGCPSGRPGGWWCIQTGSAAAWAGLEQIARPDHVLGEYVRLVLEGGLAGPCAVPLLTSGQCLWCPRALLYLQELAEELTSVYQPPAPTESAQEPELECTQKKRQSRRRKEEETDSDDPARDADFVPSKEVLLQAEEEEGSDAPLSEVSEPELEGLRGHGGKTSSAGVRAESLLWPLLTFGPA